MEKKPFKIAFPKSLPRNTDLLITLFAGIIIGSIASFAIQGFTEKLQPNLFEQGQSSVQPNTEPRIIFERIKSDGELVSATQAYSINEKVTQDPVHLFGPINLPWSEASFQYQYIGEIKAGVNLETAGFSQEEKVISVELRRPYIISNTPNMDESGIIDKDENGIFARVLPEKVEEFRATCAEKSEREAIRKGLLESARDSAEEIITNMLHAALGNEYEIAFEWR